MMKSGREAGVAAGFRVLNGHVRSDRSLVEAFAQIPSAIISDNLNRMVAAGPSVRPMHKGGTLAGTALTVKTRPGDNLMIHKAADIAQPGDVIVVDAGGDLTNALIGELIISHARSRGVVGFVVNGAVRDMDVIAVDDYPVYGAGVSHRGPYKDGPGEVNVPIALDGMVISPGDIVIGDLDGVVCIPREEAESVLAASRAQQEKEAGIQAAIAGAGWDRAWVDEILKAKGCEGV
ncbi:demethylmenaquinone methyltransferase [Aurantimonas manganoxydans SI85-9A1]|uniref:Putative 4-hydroxy-4-methyl-2-oxoglutarate aldolase n=1 Tax=Aurantimonas manganoxydans (strain ATCC BAA-1229 / DSM 21871 / SI85-9A1) TaxID=287752 RepID=Q1YDL7_AURMS|nr:demethylmenaquinone methyltransferase [Aurantimonas manganoxydans SI85-9A1]